MKVATLAGVGTRTFSRLLHELPRSLGGTPPTPARRPRWGRAPGRVGGAGPGARAPSRSRGRRAARGEAETRGGGGGGGGAATGSGRAWRRRRQRWRKRRSRRAVERRRDPRCRDPAAPGGRSRPQRTKEHAGAEEGPSSGRHEAPGAAGPAPRPRHPGRRAPLGQRSPLGPQAPARSMEPPGRRRGRPPPPLLLPIALLALLGGGRGAAALPPGCKHDGRPRVAGRAAGAAEGKVVCSSLELAQVLPPDTLPNRTVTL